MKIEIFADNLAPSDIKFNQRFFAVGLIIVGDDEVLLDYVEADMTYRFPRIAYTRESELELAVSSLAKALNVDPQAFVKTLTICEHFPKRTFVQHYFKAAIPKQTVIETRPREKKTSIWLKLANALTALDEYRGSDPHGTQKQEREFIALINSI